MIELRPDEREALREYFLPDRPGPQTGLHVLRTGLGRVHVDRWPEPRVVVGQVGDDMRIVGDPDALRIDRLRELTGEPMTIEAAPDFLPLLEAAFPSMWRWPRVIATLEGEVPRTAAPGFEVRRLGPDDASAVAGLDDPEIDWIHNSWEGPEGLAGCGFAFGAFSAAGALVSAAVPFTVGERFEDLGVVTMPEFRRRGLNLACAARVVADVRARGRQACWSTSPDNAGSLAIAERLGARKDRDDVLYMVGYVAES